MLKVKLVCAAIDYIMPMLAAATVFIVLQKQGVTLWVTCVSLFIVPIVVRVLLTERLHDAYAFARFRNTARTHLPAKLRERLDSPSDGSPTGGR
ncbi:hypothetical protein [Burkholderia cenocepacia]|uniref:hypothetical protein n=1 Tax=Burkholderia cenocepacia TaxID=95486 RepID=UPI001B9D3C74|nr:hypothetical protein [Burkholderia cenocepacia]MBR8427290.1 hypothetical protein [Burkholderia cenocepacia]